MVPARAERGQCEAGFATFRLSRWLHDLPIIACDCVHYCRDQLALQGRPKAQALAISPTRTGPSLCGKDKISASAAAGLLMGAQGDGRYDR